MKNKMCMKCRSISYCLDCNKSFKQTDYDFCPHCSKALTKAKDLEIYSTCPGLSKIRSKQCEGKITEFENVKIDLHYEHKPIHGGVILSKTCNCGNYAPKSTSGVIDYDCRNCGGKKKETLYK